MSRPESLFFCDRQLSYTEVANFTCRAENEVEIISSKQYSKNSRYKTHRWQLNSCSNSNSCTWYFWCNVKVGVGLAQIEVTGDLMILINKILRFSQEFLVIDLEFCVVSFPYEKISFISHQEMSRNNFAHDLKGREVYHFAWFVSCKVKSLIKDGFPSKFISCPGISQPPIITSPASSRYQVLHIFLELRYCLQKYHLPCLPKKGNWLIYLSISSPNLSPLQSRL